MGLVVLQWWNCTHGSFVVLEMHYAVDLMVLQQALISDKGALSMAQHALGSVHKPHRGSAFCGLVAQSTGNSTTAKRMYEG